MNTEKIIHTYMEEFNKQTDCETSDVLTSLCRAGRKHDCLVYASSQFVEDSEKTGGEWLYDVTWYEPDDMKFMKSVPVAAECEWKNIGDISDDFQKLLCARATVRVFIYDEKWFENITAQDQFSEWIKNYNDSQNGDTYLFAGYIGNGKDWRFKYFKIVVNKVNQTEIYPL